MKMIIKIHNLTFLLFFLFSSCSPYGKKCGPDNVFSCGNESHYCMRLENTDKGRCTEYPESPLIKLELPFEKGRAKYCVQGNLNVNFESSHNSSYNNSLSHFAFDFASPSNTPPNFVLASASGIVYKFDGCNTTDVLKIHADKCNNGFGNMVKIDHLNNYYTLYAHLSSIVIKDGQKVSRGEIIGLEGNTGLAGGKHIHWSLHKGDATKMAVDESIPILNVMAKDITKKESDYSSKKWSDFVCGDRSLDKAHLHESSNLINNNIPLTYAISDENLPSPKGSD